MIAFRINAAFLGFAVGALAFRLPDHVFYAACLASIASSLVGIFLAKREIRRLTAYERTLKEILRRRRSEIYVGERRWIH